MQYWKDILLLNLLGDNVSFLFIRYVRSQQPSHTRACIYIYEKKKERSRGERERYDDDVIS